MNVSSDESMESFGPLSDGTVEWSLNAQLADAMRLGGLATVATAAAIWLIQGAVTGWSWGLTIWTGLMWAGGAAQWILYKQDFRAEGWRQRTVGGQIIMGCVWGSWPAYSLPADPAVQVIMLAVLLGVLGTSVSVASVVRSVALTFIGCLSVAAAVSLFFVTSGTMLLTVPVFVLFGLFYAAIGSGLEEHHRQRAELTHQLHVRAATDPLTGGLNRSAFAQLLDRHLIDFGEVQLAFIDLDGFKAVNDSRGHEVGDELLRAISTGFETVSDSIVAGRVGGDEFLLFEPGSGELDDFAERVLGVFAEPFLVDTQTLSIRASVGVVSHLAPVATEAEAQSVRLELIRQADRAQYRAKRRGGGSEIVRPG